MSPDLGKLDHLRHRQRTTRLFHRWPILLPAPFRCDTHAHSAAVTRIAVAVISGQPLRRRCFISPNRSHTHGLLGNIWPGSKDPPERDDMPPKPKEEPPREEKAVPREVSKKQETPPPKPEPKPEPPKPQLEPSIDIKPHSYKVWDKGGLLW